MHGWIGHTSSTAHILQVSHEMRYHCRSGSTPWGQTLRKTCSSFMRQMTLSTSAWGSPAARSTSASHQVPFPPDFDFILCEPSPFWPLSAIMTIGLSDLQADITKLSRATQADKVAMQMHGFCVVMAQFCQPANAIQAILCELPIPASSKPFGE